MESKEINFLSKINAIGKKLSEEWKTIIQNDFKTVKEDIKVIENIGKLTFNQKIQSIFLIKFLQKINEQSYLDFKIIFLEDLLLFDENNDDNPFEKFKIYVEKMNLFNLIELLMKNLFYPKKYSYIVITYLLFFGEDEQNFFEIFSIFLEKIIFCKIKYIQNKEKLPLNFILSILIDSELDACVQNLNSRTKNEEEISMIVNLNEIQFILKEENKKLIIKNKNEVDLSENQKNIFEELSDNLKPKNLNLSEYFFKQGEKYLNKIPNPKSNYYLYSCKICNGKIYFSKRDFYFKINYSEFPIISRQFNYLIDKISPISIKPSIDLGEYYNFFGITFIDNNEYFYLYQIEMDDYLCNVYNINEYEYDDKLKDDSYSHYSNKNSDNNIKNKKDYTFFKAKEFENSNNFIFIKQKLIELPTLFFKLKKPNQYENEIIDDKISFNDAKTIVNNSFMECDSAFLYNKSEKLEIINEQKDKIYKISNLLKINAVEKKISEEITKSLSIDKNTILIIEEKLSIPIKIDDFKLNRRYLKKELYRSLIFVLYKLISKIKYYNEFVKNELKDDEYHFHLLLIYNNSPIVNILKVIIDYIQLIFDDIHYNFYFQIIYVSSSLTYVQRRLSVMKEDELNKKIDSLEKKVSYLYKYFKINENEI